MDFFDTLPFFHRDANGFLGVFSMDFSAEMLWDPVVGRGADARECEKQFVQERCVCVRNLFDLADYFFCFLVEGETQIK